MGPILAPTADQFTSVVVGVLIVLISPSNVALLPLPILDDDEELRL